VRDLSYLASTCSICCRFCFCWVRGHLNSLVEIVGHPPYSLKICTFHFILATVIFDFWRRMSTSRDTGSGIIKTFDPENMQIAVGILLLCTLEELEIKLYSLGKLPLSCRQTSQKNLLPGQGCVVWSMMSWWESGVSTDHPSYYQHCSWWRQYGAWYTCCVENVRSVRTHDALCDGTQLLLPRRTTSDRWLNHHNIIIILSMLIIIKINRTNSLPDLILISCFNTRDLYYRGYKKC